MLKEFKNIHIGVLCGGISVEREISLRSGKNIYKALLEEGYNVSLLDLEAVEDLDNLLNKNNVEVVFNALHGLFGEDGSLQAFLEAKKIPYTGCNMSSSVVGMNKLWSKFMAQQVGILVPPFFILKNLLFPEKKPFDFPWVIKPMLGGSSLDTHFVKNQKDLDDLKLHSEVDYLVEEMIEGVEVTCGIINKNKDEYINLPVLQLNSENEFYDYEAKYTEGKTTFIIPAPLEKEVESTVKNATQEIHVLLGCDGATRSDFIIRNNKVYFLEINTSPGMTTLSDIPAEAKVYGLSFLDVCELILTSALRRGLV